MIKVYISGNHADVIEREPLTSGTVGKVINFAFTEDWRLLIKYAVFEGSCRRIALTNIGDSCIIPHEVLAKHGGALRVGVYGRTADGSAATPTVYAQLGIIQRGADPNADPSTKPTLPVWAQLQAQIGDLSNLTTEDKTNLVAAINEAALSGGGSGGGKDGTGIESITYKGEDESGGNMYTVLLTDGTSYDITAPKGAKGDKGDAGGKGDTGVPGKAATIQVGNVTTGAAGTPASVSNVGTDEAAIFDFTIPRGDKGAAGAAGADGVTPHIGANGNWYLGSTDTGKPSRGETGLQGPAGPVGPQGPQGDKGEDATTDLTLGLTGATVSQIAKIAAVDASGVPTAWSPVDMPPGGGVTNEWTLLADITLTEDSAVIKVDKTPSGGSFSIRELAFFGGIKCDTINKTLTLSMNGKIGYGNPNITLGQVLNAAETGIESVAVYVNVLPECVFSRTQHNPYNTHMDSAPPVFAATGLRNESLAAYQNIGNPLTVFAIAPWADGKSGVFKAGTSLKFYGR